MLHWLRFQNIPYTGLSPWTPLIRLLHAPRLGSGSRGSETWAAARSWSALFAASMPRCVVGVVVDGQQQRVETGDVRAL